MLLRKARENSELANLLIGWKYPDGAANRLYYALYHAGWAFLVDREHPVPHHGGRRYFRHEQMSDLLEDEGFSGILHLDPDWYVNWDQLRSLRVKADYFWDSVRLEELREDLIEFVSEVIRGVGRLR